MNQAQAIEIAKTVHYNAGVDARHAASEAIYVLIAELDCMTTSQEATFTKSMEDRSSVFVAMNAELVSQRDLLKQAKTALYNMVEDGDATDKNQALVVIAKIEKALK